MGRILAGALVFPGPQDFWLFYLPSWSALSCWRTSLSDRCHAHGPGSLFAHNHGNATKGPSTCDAWHLSLSPTSFLLWMVLVGGRHSNSSVQPSLRTYLCFGELALLRSKNKVRRGDVENFLPSRVSKLLSADGGRDPLHFMMGMLNKR